MQPQHLTCNSCTHFNTCLIHRGLNQIIQQHFTPQTTPIQPYTVATICKKYLNNTATEIVSNITEETPP